MPLGDHAIYGFVLASAYPVAHCVLSPLAQLAPSVCPRVQFAPLYQSSPGGYLRRSRLEYPRPFFMRQLLTSHVVVWRCSQDPRYVRQPRVPQFLRFLFLLLWPWSFMLVAPMLLPSARLQCAVSYANKGRKIILSNCHIQLKKTAILKRFVQTFFRDKGRYVNKLKYLQQFCCQFSLMNYLGYERLKISIAAS